MSSGAEVLQWFLEQHPLTFPVEAPLSLFELACGFVGLTKTSSRDEAVQLSLISSFTRLAQAYFHHLGNPATARAFSSSRLDLLLDNLAACQGHMLSYLARAIERRMEPSAKAQQLLQEMLQETAVQQAVMLEVAGGCKCLFDLVERQGKRGAKKSSSSSNSRSKSSSSNSLNNTSSRGAGSRSSTAAGVFTAPAAGRAYPSSFAELSVAPDHELVAQAGGKSAVVAAYARVAGMRLEASRPFGKLLEYMQPSVLILMEADAHDVQFQASAVEVQLLLELVALAGFAMEKEGNSPEPVVFWLSPLSMLISKVTVAERRVFVAARGDLLMQVLGVLFRAVEQQDLQQQDMLARREQEDKYLATLLSPLSACTYARGLDCEGEKSADSF